MEPVTGRERGENEGGRGSMYRQRKTEKTEGGIALEGLREAERGRKDTKKE